MRVLGIDVGMKRTGLAMSDELGLTVSILPNLLARNRATALTKLMGLINEFGVKVIVIGLPVGESEHKKAVISRVLGLKEALSAQLLEAHMAVEVVLVDESYTSKTAQKTLIKSGVAQKKRKIKLDGAAAAIMVEQYLSLVAKS